MDRILTENGKWVPATPKKKVAPAPKDPVEAPAIDKDKVKEEEVKASSDEKKIQLTGQETTKELKIMLDAVGVKYSRNANSEKCLELLAPFVVESQEEVDL